jgi:hypothetical protein
LFGISSTLASTDFEGMLVEAKNLDDPTTRIRTITAMVKSAIKEKHARKQDRINRISQD